MSLLGIQTAKRTWRAEANTHFVMALLTPVGLARLVPSSGSAVANRYLELGALVGDGAAGALHADALAESESPAAALDRWLCARLLGGRTHSQDRFVQAACTVLAREERVDIAADRLGVTRRHLSRTMKTHLGIGPKVLLDLYRLDRSLRAVQARDGCGADGFADQAHQVREWSRRLGVTPGQYAREGASTLARTFGSAPSDPRFYL